MSRMTVLGMATLMVLAMVLGGCATMKQAPYEADVVVYGGTSGGVAAAVQAMRMGKSAILVGPDVHLGGLSSSGLGWADTGKKETIGGIAREFYERVADYYADDAAWQYQTREAYTKIRNGRHDPNEDAMWVFEPHVAEQIYEDFVKKCGVPVYRDEWLDRENGVTIEDGPITAIRMLSGKTFRGKIFIDATYEGDLMAAAGVTYTVGREANSVYGETLNGVQTENADYHQFFNKVSPYVVPGDSSSGLVPRVHDEGPGEEGSGDHRVQAYCFRMCLTKVPENRVAFTKPEGYDVTQYELLARYLATGWDQMFKKFDPIPNAKTDTNNRGAFSTDNIGMNYDYPEASYERRAEIIREHELYQKGLMWFYVSDPRVPPDIQAEMRAYGLAKDEFLDNDHWPHQIYVREARRMVSDFVMTELHLRRQEPTPMPIGMGSYNMDSHHVQRYVVHVEDGEDYVLNEGDVQINPGGPYPISYRAIVPKQEECENLLVPVCLSSSHIAYGSIRMEPVFMVLGQSAATAAAQAIDAQCAVQQIDYDKLRNKLAEDGQVLELVK